MLLHRAMYQQQLHTASAAALPQTRQLYGACQHSMRHLPHAGNRQRLFSASSSMQALANSTRSASIATAASAAPSYLKSLSAEQKAAVVADQQHVRVIAGPGSGKTRTVIARVIWLLKQGAAPGSILVITFTRKAAEELRQRLEAEFGRVPYGLMACTFHSLCTNMLRRYRRQVRLSDWTVADDDDVNTIIKDILTPKDDSSSSSTSSSSKPGSGSESDADSSKAVRNSRSSSASSTLVRSSRSRVATSKPDSSSNGGSSMSAGSKKATTPQTVDPDVVKYFCSMVSAMKNFVETTHRGGQPRQGADIVQELQATGEKRFDLDADKAGRLARVYDSYNRLLRRQHKLDFDDLLHHCLALVHHHGEVRGELHKRWQHVLVDEGQDTNMCQFELIRQITGPRAYLYMVGDPDQAIYGFRGAKSRLLQRRFETQFPDTSATYYLLDNYRSRPAIIRVADLIRRVGQRKDDVVVAGRSQRADGGTAVQLLASEDEFEEADSIARQLQQWHSKGYAWNDMAVLCRAKRPLRMAYRAAAKAGIPAHIQTGDLWESVEVKTLLALLRAVVHPVSAGEGLRKRVISSNVEVKVPMTTGLGPTAVNAIAAAIEAHHGADSSSSSPSSDVPSSLGSCLLAGCGCGSLSAQDAAGIWQQWEAAPSAGQEPMDALQGLTPSWQQLPGLKALNKKQQAGVDRLRGLVQLAAAAAILGQTPEQVLKLLLDFSGMWQMLDQSARAAAPKDKERKSNRLKNVQVLLDLASRADRLLDDAEQMAVLSTTGDDTDTDSSSSSGSSASGVASDGDQASIDGPTLLRQFMDLCALQGDGDEGDVVRPRVAFMTMHASKGKEYGCVATMSFYEGVLPSSQATTADEREQERNVAYVAVTRARDHLLITWPQSVRTDRFSQSSTEISTFLRVVYDHAQKSKLPGVEIS